MFMISSDKFTLMWTDKAINFAKRNIFVMTTVPDGYWLEVIPEKR